MKVEADFACAISLLLFNQLFAASKLGERTSQCGKKEQVSTNRTGSEQQRERGRKRVEKGAATKKRNETVSLKSWRTSKVGQ